MNRLMAILLALLSIALAPLRAAVVYSGLQNLGIPTDIAGTGIYLDLDAVLTGTDDNSPPADWDINPFYGGVGVANSPAFQPVRDGAGNMAPILGLAVGVQVDVTRLFSTGNGGSDTHLGTQFTAGQEGYLGFKFTTNAATGPYYGWMRVVFTGNTAGALIKDWAYENGGGAIVTARVAQSAAVASAQVVTLSPGTGESFTLGSALTNTGGNINSLVKTGLGTAILSVASSHTGGTTVNGGVLGVHADSALGVATGGVTISNAATLQAGNTFTSNRAVTLGTGGGKIDTNGNTVAFASVTGSTLTKLGSGALILRGAQSYNALTASAGTTNINSVLGTAPGLAAVTVSPGATAIFGNVSQTLASLTIGAGATVTFTSGPQNSTKDDSSTLTLTGLLDYATLTTNAGVLNVNGVIGSGTSTVAVNNVGTKLKFGSVSQTLAALSIGAGATVIFTSGTASGSFSGGEDGKALNLGGDAAAVVPEPGTFGLLAVGALGALGWRRVPRGRGKG